MSVPYSRYLIGDLPWYGILIMSGVIVAYFLAVHEQKRRHLPDDTIIDLVFLLIPLGIIGARLYYVCFNWNAFQDDFLSIFRIWEGGIAIYGAVIGGVIAILIFAFRRHLNPLALTDSIVPGLSLAQGIGRWGNYFNMEAYGREIVDPAWQFFPVGVLIPSINGSTWHMATFFYESCWDIAVFVILWFILRKRSKVYGVVTLWYFILYGVGRYFIEGLRTDSLMLGSIRISQLLSLLLVLFSAVILCFLAARKHIRK